MPKTNVTQLESTASPLFRVTITDTVDDVPVTLFDSNISAETGGQAIEVAHELIQRRMAPPKPYELTYADKRRAEYPTLTDQLDQIFHEGIDAWRAAIQEIKDRNPKP